MNYDELINKRVSSLKPSGIRKFFDVVSEMPDAISLGVGEPDFVTPWEIRDAAIKSVQKGITSYTSNMGLPSLRAEIADFLHDRYALNYNYKDEVMVTVGASEAIDLALRALISDGDEVVVPEPSYVSYSPCVTLAGGVAVALKSKSSESFIITPQGLEACLTPRTKVLILPFPNNPTGAIMSKAQLEAIAPIIIKHNLVVLSDEIYAELTYGSRHFSIAALPQMRERTVVLSGFSKAFAMTGWRVGFIAAPKEFLSPIVKIHQYTIMCASTVGQYAALGALTTGKKNDYAVVNEMRESYNMRRRFLVDAFNNMGLCCFEPLGAFYVFPSVKKSKLSGEEFAQRLLMEQKVAVIPGSAFGESVSDFVRCCYACSMNDLYEAVTRMQKFMQQL